MSPNHFDVIIVGSGPAGSAAAIRFRQADPNISVALIDKATFPRDKACGDGLGPWVVPQLVALGVDISKIPHLNHVSTAEVHGPDGLSFHTEIGEAVGVCNYGMTARRVDFDYLLVQRAEQIGVELIQSTRFEDYSASRASTIVNCKDLIKQQDLTLQCNLLIGADGANSRVRRAAGIDANSADTTGIAIRAYANIQAHNSDRIILSFEDSVRPGYGWCFPFSDGTANIGVGMVISDYRRLRPDLKSLLQDYIADLEAREILLSDVSDHAIYTLPHGGKLPKLVGPRLALLGDAASMINPLSGEGIVYGMRSSEFLVENVALALSDVGGLQEGLREYEKQFRRYFGAHLRSNYISHRLLRSRLWTRMVLGAASLDPKLQRSGVDLMFGNGKLAANHIVRIVLHGTRYLLNG